MGPVKSGMIRAKGLGCIDMGVQDRGKMQFFFTITRDSESVRIGMYAGERCM